MNQVAVQSKEITNYPNYTISFDGTIKNKKGHIMKHFLTPDGYTQLTLTNNGIRKTHLIHRLLAIHFIDNPQNLKEVDHINLIRNDNAISNLRWINCRKNNQNKSVSSIFGHNIRITKYGTYRMCIRIDKIRLDFTFKTLQKAVKFRDEILSFL